MKGEIGRFLFRVGLCADRRSRHIPGTSHLFFFSFLSLHFSLWTLRRTPSKYSPEEHIWAGVEILWKHWLCFGQSPSKLDALLRGLVWDIVPHNMRDIHDIYQVRHIRENEIILKGLIHIAPKTMACVLARTYEMRYFMSTRYLLSKGVKTTRERKKRN